MAYIVKAALVIARGEDGRDTYLYQGAPVPSSIPAVEVDRLASEGFLVEVGSPEPAESEPAKSEPAKSEPAVKSKS